MGVERLAALAGQPFAEVLAYGERRMRAALAALPDGTWRFADVIDSFGSGPDQQEPSVIALTVGVAGDQVTFDFTGSQAQRRGNVNAVEAVTVSAVAFAVRAALDPTLPANAGTLAPVHVVAPAGTIVDARPPAAVGAGNVEVSQRVADVCFGALARSSPDRVGAAAQGTMNNVLVGNDRLGVLRDDGRRAGRSAAGRGRSGHERRPHRHDQHPQHAHRGAGAVLSRCGCDASGCGGAVAAPGCHPGGDGIERDLEVLEAATLSLITERRTSPPWGLDGGQPGAVGENWLLPGGDESRARAPGRQVHRRAGRRRRRSDPHARRRRLGSARDLSELDRRVRFRRLRGALPRLPAMDINGISAIVTGGASGIGEAVSRQLAGRGAKVVIADLQDDKGNALATEIGGAFAHVDVTNPDDVIAAIETAKEMGPLRALVNSAGIGWASRTIGRDGTYESAHDLDVYRKVIEVNLIGTFNCIRLAATAMSTTDPLESGERGAIVNMASLAAFDGQIGQAAYSSSKGGVVGMTLPVARDLSAVGVRVNTVAPGLIDTPIYGTGEASEAFKANLAKDVLFPKRLGSADELASMVVELVGNSYMNAETIRVDGGLRMPPK